MSLIIYSHSITPRLQYVVDFISNYFDHPIAMTSSSERYLATSGVKLNYSHEHLSEGELYIYPHSLLFETGKRQVVVECFSWHDYTAFFKSNSVLGFDLFAAIFFLITRYEEYLPHHKDQYGRYDHKESLAFKAGFLHLPLVNIWLEDFRKLLANTGDDWKGERKAFFTPTYDIDIAWSYLNKGFKRNAGGFIKDLIKGKWWYVNKRLKVLRRKEQDPFDTYEWLNELHAKYSLEPIYFFPLAKDTNRYDKNIDPANDAYRSLIQEHAAHYKTGLHPSWQSGDAPHLLTAELRTLEQISSQNVIRSRQHFIRFSMPETYRRLIALGIREDYSMGYGSINGFRASICTPWYWYDLEKEEKTELLLYPFCFMDANAFFEQHQTPEQALADAINYYRIVQKVNGYFITIWHTPFLGTDQQFTGWKQAYEKLIDAIHTV